MNSYMKNYISIARPDHWIKQLFIIPGIILAYLLTSSDINLFPTTIIFGFLSACLLSSANYVINEWLDAKFDMFHPIKKNRPAVAGLVVGKYVYLEYAVLIILGLFLAKTVSFNFFVTAIILIIMGVLYNVKPFRIKDRIYCDVLIESINNPIRLMLGWSMVSTSTIAPMSLLVCYWCGGAFLMSAKRLAEYRYIAKQGKLEDLKRYRKSFQDYTEEALIISSFLYGLLSSFFLAAFLLKYRNEYLFVFPLFAILFSYYLAISLRSKSSAQTPEKLHKEKRLVAIVIALIIFLILFTVLDVPYAKVLIGEGQGINYKIWK